MLAAMSFVTRIGKLPLPCRSAPGFVVNRLLTPYMLEALHAHADGHSLESIDAAAKAFGMPMGPVELADRVGLDVALHVAEILSECAGGRAAGAAASQGRKRRARRENRARLLRVRCTRQADQGPRPRRASDDELADRLLLPLINEAVACLHEGVVADADLLDAGVVFGAGFAPFTGGPIRYARRAVSRTSSTRLDAARAAFWDALHTSRGWRDLR